MVQNNKFERQQGWRIGVVDSKDYDSLSVEGKVRVRLVDKQPGILTKGLPVLFPFTGVNKAFFMPKVGDRVVVMTDENTEDGIVLGAIYSKQNKPLYDDSDIYSIDFDDGTFIRYDKTNKILKLKSAWHLEIEAVTWSVYLDDDLVMDYRDGNAFRIFSAYDLRIDTLGVVYINPT
jgi:phage baseplate assembly protein V